MSLRLVRSMLPPASAAAAVYAGLESGKYSPDRLEQPPFKKKRLPPVGHQHQRRPRELSEKQRRTFLGEAAKRIKGEALARVGQYLRRLDTIHESGRRSRSELWGSLGAAIEPLLARVDVATGVVGYLDANGHFRLNRQNGIAEDAGISPASMCRLFNALEKAGYVLRKIKRLFRNGKDWVTRVSIYIRPRFFHDLGLGMAHANARTAKALSFIKKRRQAEAKQQQERLDETARAHERRMSHRKAEARRAELERQAEADRRISSMQSRFGRMAEFARANPGKSHQELVDLFNQRFPPP